MRDVTPDVTPSTGTDPENRRPADDRTRPAKHDDTVPAGEAVRPGETGRRAETAPTGDAVPAGETVRPGSAGLGGGHGSTGEAVRSGDRVPTDGTALPGGRTPSKEPGGTTAAGEGTRFGAGADDGAGRATHGSPAGAEQGERGADALRASGDGTPARHQDAGAVHTDTVAGRVPTAAAAEPGGHGASLLPVDECDRIASRLRHAVVGFVDGPRDAVAEADQVLEELAARFTDAVDRRRRTLRGSWQSTEGAKDGKDRAVAAATTADTEQLRLALRDYRELTERLLHL
ncbi:hypothetical protein [Streptomyces sp. NPDC017435]|uniref:hypothetical protein n=1 Tax=Streptomyces sp. NPDC017435 TaxID=3364995 RepID=UPI0037A5F719